MSDEPHATKQANLLIVDDTPANLQLLAEMLKQHGYHTRMVRSGALALQAVAHEPPDLILLDILMPEMDGYEVCARLKADLRTREIPVLFISAITEPLDKVKAFRAGGVDYLTKPFHEEEVAARVHTHLELRRQQRELQAKYAQLRDIEALRDNLVHMIVHDLRAPLTGLQGGLELLVNAGARLEANDRKWVALAHDSARELSLMVATMLDVVRLESNQMPLHPAPADLADIVRHGLELLGPEARARCDLDTGAGGPIPVACDAALLVRVVSNLAANALKFSPAQARVAVQVVADGDAVRVRVTDHGPGIAPQFHAGIFDKFGQLELRRVHKKASTGLGLAFCRLAVEAHGGRIGLESAEGQGSTFWFEVPAKREFP